MNKNINSILLDRFSIGRIPSQTDFHDLINSIPYASSLNLTQDYLDNHIKDWIDHKYIDLFDWLQSDIYKIIYINTDLNFTNLDTSYGSTPEKIIFKNAKIIVDHKERMPQFDEGNQVPTTIQLNTRFEFINCDIIGNDKCLTFIGSPLNDGTKITEGEIVLKNSNLINVYPDPNINVRTDIGIDLQWIDNTKALAIRAYNSKIVTYRIGPKDKPEKLYSDYPTGCIYLNSGSSIEIVSNGYSLGSDITIYLYKLESDDTSIIKNAHIKAFEGRGNFKNCNLEYDTLLNYGNDTGAYTQFLTGCYIHAKEHNRFGRLFNVKNCNIDYDSISMGFECYAFGNIYDREDIFSTYKGDNLEWETMPSTGASYGNCIIKFNPTTTATLSLDDNTEKRNYTIKFYDKQKNFINNFEIQKFRLNIVDVNNYQISEDKTTITYIRPKDNNYIELCLRVYFPDLNVTREWVHVLNNDNDEDLIFNVFEYENHLL